MVKSKNLVSMKKQQKLENIEVNVGEITKQDKTQDTHSIKVTSGCQLCPTDSKEEVVTSGKSPLN